MEENEGKWKCKNKQEEEQKEKQKIDNIQRWEERKKTRGRKIMQGMTGSGRAKWKIMQRNENR